MTIQYEKVHPYKVNVVRELQKALDDPKRAVRRAAVEARYVSEFVRILADSLRVGFRAAWCGANVNLTL